MKISKAVMTIAVLAIGAGAVTACNTVQGAGQDIEAAGETVQDAAN